MGVDRMGSALRVAELGSASHAVRTALERALRLSLLAAVGCSYGFVHGTRSPVELPTSGPEQVTTPRPDCTSSNAWPIVDTVLSVPLLGAGGLLIAAGVAEHCSNSCFGPSSGEAILLGAV